MITPETKRPSRIGLPTAAAAVALCIVYAGCVTLSGYVSKIPDTMFWYGDSRTYLAVSDWIASGNPTPYTAVRPFLYPLLILFPYKFAGVWGIWCLQTAMWVASGTLLFAAVLRLCRSIWIASGATLIFAVNVSLMFLTLYALTEVAAAFLLCVGMIIAVGGVPEKQKPPQSYRRPLLMFVVALLTVVKPVFLYVLIPLTVFHVSCFIVKSRGSTRCYSLLLLLAALSPVLVQVGIMRATHQRWGISDIGGQTFNRYMFAVLYSRVEQLPLEQARSEVAEFSLREMASYALGHFHETVEVWRNLVRINLTSGSASAVVPGPHPFLTPYMTAMNRLYYCIHLAMIVPVILVTLLMSARGNGTGLGRLILFAWPVMVVFAASGITFWQSDRIVVPVLPVWIAMYAFVLQRLFLELRHGLQVFLDKTCISRTG